MIEVEKKAGPFKRFGGSSRYAEAVVKVFPAHDTYVEPFAGAASCLFTQERSKREILVDLSPDVVHALRTVQKLTPQRVEQLKRRFDWVSSRAMYQRALSCAPKDADERFWKFMYLSRFSFSGVLPQSLAYIGSRLVVDNLLRFRERLRGVEIHLMDYRDAVRKFDGRATFFFVDPPYPGEWSDRVVGSPKGCAKFDLDALAKVLNAAKGAWMLVLGDQASHRMFIRQLEGRRFSLSVQESVPRGGGNKQARRYFLLRTRKGKMAKTHVAVHKVDLADGEELMELAAKIMAAMSRQKAQIGASLCLHGIYNDHCVAKDRESGKLFRFDVRRTDGGGVELGSMTEVRQVFVPVNRMSKADGSETTLVAVDGDVMEVGAPAADVRGMLEAVAAEPPELIQVDSEDRPFWSGLF